MLISINKLLYQWYNKLFIDFHFINGTIEFQNIFKPFYFFSLFIISFLME